MLRSIFPVRGLWMSEILSSSMTSLSDSVRFSAIFVMRWNLFPNEAFLCYNFFVPSSIMSVLPFIGFYVCAAIVLLCLLHIRSFYLHETKSQRRIGVNGWRGETEIVTLPLSDDGVLLNCVSIEAAQMEISDKEPQWPFSAAAMLLNTRKPMKYNFRFPPANIVDDDEEIFEKFKTQLMMNLSSFTGQSRKAN